MNVFLKIRNQLLVVLALFVLSISSPVKAIEPSTSEQNIWWNTHVVTFLKAYYVFDFDKAWELGEVAFKFPPYEFKTKKDFVEYENNRRFGFDDGISMKMRRVIDIQLLRVDIINKQEWFYTLISWQAIYKPTAWIDNISFEDDEEGAVCNRMEWVLFRKGEYGFDRIVNTDSMGMGCFGYGMNNEE